MRSNILLKLIFVILVLLQVTFVLAQAPSISYQTPQTYPVNTAILPLGPSNSGGVATGAIITTVVKSDLLNYPQNMAVDDAGNVYLTTSIKNVIDKIAVNGTTSTLGSDMPHPYKVATDNSGKYVYVVDYFQNFWRILTATGIATKIGSGSAVYHNVAVDAAGNAYVTYLPNFYGETFIQKFSLDGSVTTLTSFRTLSYPNLAVNSSGSKVYFGESGPTIKMFTIATGVVSTLPINLKSGSNIGNITVDNSDNVYVSDLTSGTINKFDPVTGATTIILSGINNLICMDIDASGTIYELESPTTLSQTVKKTSFINYTIDKTLPAGLFFNNTTGVISGTPTVTSPATNYTITAYNSSSGSSSTIVNISVTRELLPSVITFPPPVVINIDPDNILHSNASSSNTETPITYTSSNPAVAYIGTDGLVHVIAPGITIITAYQSGNANYKDAVSVSETFTITQGQVIQFSPIVVKNTCDNDFSVGAISSNSLIPLTYSSSNPAVATVSATGIIHIVSSGNTTITVSQTGNNLYTPAIPKTQTLTVNAPVTPIVSITPDNTNICVGMPVNFTAMVTNAGNNPVYQWQVNGVNLGANSAIFTTTNITKSDIIQCIVTNNDSCPLSSASNKITGINADPYITPVVSITSSASGPVCSGTPITFTASEVNFGANPSYSWQVNGVSLGSNNSVLVSSNFANGDIVTCTLTNTTSKCITPRTVTSNVIKINVIPLSNTSLSIVASVNQTYAGTPVTFTALPVSLAKITSYQWQVNGINVGTNSSTFTSTNLKTSDQVACTITVNDPCTTPVISLPVSVNILRPPTVNIPNTFTPNGDGINDYWNIPSLTFYPNCLLSVYNRYGAQVYQSKGYGKAWDGSISGAPLSVGTYYYVIDLMVDGMSKKISGGVTIIR